MIRRSFFDRLVAVRHPAAGEGNGFPVFSGYPFFEQLRGTVFGHDLRFEIETGIETEILVVGAGVAVGAAMFAPAVGIETVGEADVGALIGGEYRLAFVPENFGDGSSRFEILLDPRDLLPGAVVEMQRMGFEAVSGRLGCSTSPRGKVQWHMCKYEHV